jgi:hypothetical protein
MIVHVKTAKYLHDYVLWVRFNDGAEGEVDLDGELEGEVFEPLKKLSLFRALRVDPVLQTVVWPNEADLAPEFLYEKMKPLTDEEQDRTSVSRPLAVRENSGTYTMGRPPLRRATGNKAGKTAVEPTGRKKSAKGKARRKPSLC